VCIQFATSSPPLPSNGVVRSLRQYLSFLVLRHNHGPPVVEVALGRNSTVMFIFSLFGVYLSFVYIATCCCKLPEYKKVDDTRHLACQQCAVPQDNDSADVDLLPDVHWCKAFLCYYSCLGSASKQVNAFSVRTWPDECLREDFCTCPTSFNLCIALLKIK
jgi:hypothetical protein